MYFLVLQCFLGKEKCTNMQMENYIKRHTLFLYLTATQNGGTLFEYILLG